MYARSPFVPATHTCEKRKHKTKRIHSSSGLSVKLEWSAFPTESTIAEVVMDDSMQRIAAMASNLVTSFLNINLACAGINVDGVKENPNKKVCRKKTKKKKKKMKESK